MRQQSVDKQSPPSTSVLGIHHIGMAVRNLSSAVAFYETTSLERLSLPSISGAQLLPPTRTAVLKAPNGHIELMEFPEHPTGSADTAPMPVEGPGATHACFQSPAHLSLYRKLDRAAASPVSRGDPPIDLNGRGVCYAYARDADGIMFEVEELDKPRFEGPIWLAHIALVSPDIDRLVAFYRNLLGVEPYQRANKIGGPRWDEVTGIDDVSVRAAWFNTGNMILELWQYTSPATPSPNDVQPFDRVGYNKIAIEVEDLSVECARLTRDGVVFLNEPVVKNGIEECYLRDPDGNLLSLLQTGPAAPARVADLKKIDWLPSPAAPADVPG